MRRRDDSALFADPSVLPYARLLRSRSGPPLDAHLPPTSEWIETDFGWRVRLRNEFPTELEWITYPAGSWILVRAGLSRSAVLTIPAGEA